LDTTWGAIDNLDIFTFSQKSLLGVAQEVILVVGLKHHRFFSPFKGAALDQRQGASDKEFLKLTFRFHYEIIRLLK
jgi:hypothetical protein